jgi:eukaryotic-like serine/threonine-protein kinase
MPDTVIGGRYRLDDVLGRGGMSEVWLAEDLELGRLVAIKLLAPDADNARFEREARAVASLAHPNITQLYDYGEDGGRPYIVLEYLPGGTLEERLRSGTPLSDDETFGIAAGIAAGLAHAHARGVVHRDLKPANVLFDEEGRPKLADFGIARMAAGEGTLTEAGTVLGTAAYISPEQAMGEPATAASDVYSFGVILYRLLAGRLPFESDDPLRLVMLHRTEPPTPISELRSDAPPALESTALEALAKDPADRPRNGAALLAELGLPAGGPTTATRMLDGEATRVLPVAAAATAEPPVPPGPPPAPPRRSRALLAAAGLVVLALAGGAIAYAMTQSSAPAQPTTLPTFTLPSTKKQTTSAATTTTAPPPSTASATQGTTTSQATTAATHTTTTTPPTTTQAPPPTTTIAPPTTTAAPPTTTTAPPTTSPPAVTTTP